MPIESPAARRKTLSLKNSDCVKQKKNFQASVLKRNFTCDCHYSNISKTEVKKHYRKEHVRNQLCSLCGARFFEMLDIKNHMNEHIKFQKLLNSKFVKRKVFKFLDNNVDNFDFEKITLASGGDPVKKEVLEESEKVPPTYRTYSKEFLNPQNIFKAIIPRDGASQTVTKVLGGYLAQKSVIALNSIISGQKLTDFYKCGKYTCSFTTNCNETFKKHLMSHKVRNLVCVYCGTVYKDVDDLVYHVSVFHQDRIYQCGFCLFRSISLLHLKIHHNYAHSHLDPLYYVCKTVISFTGYSASLTVEKTEFLPYVCGITKCGFKSFDPELFKNHVHQAAGIHQINGILSLPCYVCHIEYTDPELLVNHLMEHKIGNVQCTYCQYCAPSVQEILVHVCHFHADLPVEVSIRNSKRLQSYSDAHCGSSTASQGRNPFLEKVCGNGSFVSSRTALESLVTCEHVTNNLKSCTHRSPSKKRLKSVDVYSGYSVKKSEEALQVMLEEETVKKFFKCFDSHCSFCSNNPEDFSKHITAHKETQAFCVYCGIPFKSTNMLVKHVILRHGSRVYQCRKCLYRAVSCTHISLHSIYAHDSFEELSYKCEKVSYSSFLTNLSIPVPKKVDLKRLICNAEGCTFASFDEESFRNHLKIHTGHQHLTCYMCCIVCQTVTDLIAHFRGHGIGNVQCSYCPYFSETAEDMLKHLCYIHADYPVQFFIRDVRLRENFLRSFKSRRKGIVTRLLQNSIIDTNGSITKKARVNIHNPSDLKFEANTDRISDGISSDGSDRSEAASFMDSVLLSAVPSRAQEENLLNCPFCDFAIQDVKELKKHCRSDHHKNAELPDLLDILVAKYEGESIYFCPFCTFSTKYRRKIRHHFIMELERATFVCGICAIYVEDLNKLADHLITDH